MTIKFATIEIGRMKEILENGLDPIYSTFDSFLYFADFSWNIESYKKEGQALLASVEWTRLAALIKENMDMILP